MSPIPAPGHRHWRCAWCLRWNVANAAECHECGRDLELPIGTVLKRETS